MASNDLVSVTLVTYNSGRFIKRCLESVLEQKYLNMEVVVIDNASTDGTVDILEQFADRCRIYYNDENVGFAAAQNQAIALSQGEWVLTLNPDVLLLPNFIQALVDAGQVDPKVGSVCGKLLTIRATFDLPDKQLVDSTGIYFTPMLRHLDRGSQEVDNGHYLNFEYVFGATAAAALYRRSMIEDIAILGEFFDPDFFVYREDADVAWRAQLMGWRCIYTPLARGYHVRNVLPGNRRALPSGDQHALGEEPVPDAPEEHDAGSVPAQLALHHGARFRGGGRVPSARARIAQGVLVSGAQLEAGDGKAPRDHEAPQGQGRLHFQLVFLSAREPARAPSVRPGCGSRSRRPRLRSRADQECDSRSSAPAASRRATAALKPSPKSFRRASPHADTASRSTAAKSIPNPRTAACG